MKRLFRIFISLIIIVFVFIQSGTSSVESDFTNRDTDTFLETQTRDGVTSINKTVDKTVANPGDILTYMINDIGYSGSELLSDVTVTDQNPAGTTYVPNSAIPESVENEGLLMWDVGSNSPGIIGQAGESSGSVTINSGPTPNRASSTPSLTFSHFTDAGTNRLLLVGVSFGHTTLSRTITSVTYGGINLNPAGNLITNGNTRRVAIYYLVMGEDLYTMREDISINFTGSVDVVAGAITFAGVDQQNPIGILTGATGSSSIPSIEVITASNNLVFDTVAFNTRSLIVDVSQIAQWNRLNASSGATITGAASTELAGGALTTMSWSNPDNISSLWAIGAVAIKPASSPPTRTTTVNAYPTLISSGGNFTLKATLTNTEADDIVTTGNPIESITGGASAACGLPSPASGSIVAGGSLEFTWTCTATAEPGSFGSVALSIDAENGYYASGRSNTVLVVPGLTYQVTIDVDPGVTVIENTASIQGSGGISTTSSTATTAIPTIGDLVWEDDGDGIQQAGEPGVANVSVTLYTSAGVQVGQVLTDTNGKYAYYDVDAGDYYLYFGLPDNYSYTLKEQGGNTVLDSNVDPSTGRTSVFTWENAASDLDLDAGLIRRYVTKSDRTVTLTSDPLFTCCESYLVSQTVSASAPAEGTTTPATLLRLSDTLADEFMIIPDSDTGCTFSNISEDGKTLTCNWDAQNIDTPTIITYQIRKASAAAITTSGTYATHTGSSLHYNDHLGREVALNYGAGTTTASLSGADVCQGDIEIEKILMNGSISAGDPVVFRLVVTNNSGFPLSGFVITDTLDPLLTFTSANPAICDYSGSAGVTYGGTVTCTTSTPFTDQSSFQIDLTTLFKPESEDYFGENTATVACPWCIVDIDNDSSSSPTGITGVINFQAGMAGDILVSWESVDESWIRGFKLYRSRGMAIGIMIYEVEAANMFDMGGEYYQFSDREYVPGVLYAYWLEVLWVDGSSTFEATTEIIGPYHTYLPLLR